MAGVLNDRKCRNSRSVVPRSKSETVRLTSLLSTPSSTTSTRPVSACAQPAHFSICLGLLLLLFTVSCSGETSHKNHTQETNDNIITAMHLNCIQWKLWRDTMLPVRSSNETYGVWFIQRTDAKYCFVYLSHGKWHTQGSSTPYQSHTKWSMLHHTDINCHQKHLSHDYTFIIYDGTDIYILSYDT